MSISTLNRTASIARQVAFLAHFGLLAMLPLSAFSADVNNGQKLYELHCSGCHGLNGISEMPQAPNLARFDLFNQPDQTLMETIQSGRNDMPPYFGILNDSEILDVITYLRTFH